MDARMTGIVLAMALGACTRAGAARIEVTDERDAVDAAPGDGACEATPGRGDCTLRAAIMESNELPGKDLVVLPAGVFRLGLPGEWDETSATGDLDILDDLTLQGAGSGLTTLDGAGLDRVLDVPRRVEPALSVTIEALTIRGGSRGGIRSLAGCALTVRGCAIEDNRALTAGGGIYSRGGSLTLVDTVVAGNCASMGAGGISVHAADVSLIRSRVVGNVLEGSSAGGMYASHCRIRLEDAVVADNTLLDESDGASGCRDLVLASSVILGDVPQGPESSCAAVSPLAPVAVVAALPAD